MMLVCTFDGEHSGPCLTWAGTANSPAHRLSNEGSIDYDWGQNESDRGTVCAAPGQANPDGTGADAMHASHACPPDAETAVER